MIAFPMSATEVRSDGRIGVQSHGKAAQGLLRQSGPATDIELALSHSQEAMGWHD
jgi:hypothetical protein